MFFCLILQLQKLIGEIIEREIDLFHWTAIIIQQHCLLLEMAHKVVDFVLDERFKTGHQWNIIFN